MEHVDEESGDDEQEWIFPGGSEGLGGWGARPSGHATAVGLPVVGALRGCGGVAALSPAVRVAVIIENETTYLTVPVPDGGVVIWGKGFEVDRVAALPWLRGALIHYWGDLDTHGFAILDKLRAWLPRARSFLMDRETLLAHRES